MPNCPYIYILFISYKNAGIIHCCYFLLTDSPKVHVNLKDSRSPSVLLANVATNVVLCLLDLYLVAEIKKNQFTTKTL